MPKSDLITDQDRTQLRRALELAELGRGRVSPNPLVGAVVVRDGEVIGEGHHAELGGVHAEVAALADCRGRGHDPAGATMYVTLEPCAHHGRQPACTEALILAGVARVVIASDDPSEKASGRGPGTLRDEGIEVEFADGSEAASARLLNQAFRKHARTGRPLVVFKSALSLDGRVATADGESQWISGAESRALVHRWRAESGAVAVGIGTALADDPLLTARETDPPPERQPARVVFDTEARLPLASALVGSVADARLIVVADPGAPRERVAALEGAGAELVLAAGTGTARVETALDELGRREITSVLLEGGPTLAGSFFDAGEVDRLAFFIAPIVLGGRGSRSVVEGEGVRAVADAPRALATSVERIGDDVLIEARLKEW
jgi:diaminohydroxyphosphoribosylaminopyrimidine deaminase/5-amino-6-(5-phosphoribosylamino)uracil reductase